jgi:cellulose synthase/poly-beta-1,6-N-acetylglucosamine synthase-like glycosyltransferase
MPKIFAFALFALMLISLPARSLGELPVADGESRNADNPTVIFWEVDPRATGTEPPFEKNKMGVTEFSGADCTSLNERHSNNCQEADFALALTEDTTQESSAAAEEIWPIFSTIAPFVLQLIVVLIGVYALRHYFFVLNRLFGKQRHPYLDIDIADWPSVTVVIAAHNEEAVIAGSLHAVLQVDYPREKLTIMPMNDRSTDRTREIVDAIVRAYPGRISPFHRTGGKPGKAAALKDAMRRVESQIVVVFDADYLPPRSLLKQLVSPFFDPEVGATMGRVVPSNTGTTLLARLLDLERSGGYQVDQQARMNLGLVPQYGGTVGGVRVRALESIGGWADDVLAEDTDLTYRLLLRGWKTVYQNRAECYEEVPETWSVRIRQIMRWAKGHNQALYRHGWKVATKRGLRAHERVDGLALLGVYLMAPLLIVAWLLTIALFLIGASSAAGVGFAVLSLASYGALGNFAAFYEIAAAAYLDNSRERLRLLPFNSFGFVVSMISISRAAFDQAVLDPLLKREFRWEKTKRYRRASS